MPALALIVTLFSLITISMGVNIIFMHVETIHVESTFSTKLTEEKKTSV
jgi:hypothetical protein